jgi:hypothetical protein
MDLIAQICRLHLRLVIFIIEAKRAAELLLLEFMQDK